ncbi:MAG: ATP-binding protein, partial [Burkholderiaceae bacterium]
DLEEVWLNLAHEFEPRAAKKQISLSVDFSVRVLSGHAFALSLLLRNLVANAINYTPAGGRVRVSSATEGEVLLLRVDDSGPGIPAIERERAFERFNRLGLTQIEGVGLGLSIVLSVVELHHAAIRLLDSPLGGLRAQVAFPMLSAASPPRAGDSPGAPGATASLG